ncbi:hypothetical protein FQT01_02775 [Enterococcus faecalis]|uniref:DUF7006 family protein n=1 Tax=Enterococcus faecalis TaxID=1351 RepID=UPI001A95A528|nr:hypothetical protein [Enterococcus faecalis]MBO1104232.1 hypothetical protein [Enterococcus faecalis]
MKRTLDYLDEKTYFQYFERKYTDPVFQENYPLISEKMKELCKKMKKTITTSSPKCFFKVHAEILGLDAQLQILMSLTDLVDNKEVSEEMIIKCAQEDYPIFMRELCDNTSHDFLENTLYFSVI